MKKTRVLVFLSLLVAMDIILVHIVPVIQLDIIRISFGFVPESFSAMLFGPWIGGLGSAIADILGMIIAPKGAYFPGFTLSALLTGVIYGLLLYKQPKTLLRISLAVICVTLVVDIGLNTYWLTILMGKGYLALLPARLVKSAIMAVVQIPVIFLMWRYAGKLIGDMLNRGKDVQRA